MKKLFCVVGLLLLAFSALYSQSVIVAANWHVRFNGPGNANDFHVEGIIQSQNNFMPMLVSHFEVHANGATVWWMKAYSISQMANPTDWYFKADFKTNGVIAPGAVLHIGMKWKTNYCNVARVTRAYWTLNGAQVGPNIPLPGFMIYRGVLASGGNLLATFYNDDPQAGTLNLEQIEFAVTAVEVPLEDMFSTGLGEPGTGGNSQYDLQWIKFPDPVILQPGKDITIDLTALGVDLPAGNFLQFRTFANGEPWWGQHQEPPAGAAGEGPAPEIPLK